MINVTIIVILCLSTIGSLLTCFLDAMLQKRELRVSHSVLLIMVCLFALFIIFVPISDASLLSIGLNMLNSGEYSNAEIVFENLNDEEMRLEARYSYAKQLYSTGNFESSIEIFTELGDYKDSQQYLQRAKLSIGITEEDLQTEQDKMYSLAYQYYNSEQFIQALSCFKTLNGYKDSDAMMEKCISSVRKNAGHRISAGIRLALAVKKDGTILSAGYSDNFDFTQWKDIVSISNLGSVAIGLKNDGTVVSTGPYFVNVDDWTDIIAISAGEQYVIGLKSDGTVVGAGHDLGDGQLQISGWNDIIAIATGWRHTVGLSSDGTIHITGYRSSSQLAEISKEPSKWSNIVAIAAGGGGSVGTGHTVGLRADGTVVAVGDNSYGQCNVGDWSNIIAIAAGDWHTIGLRSDGTVVSTRPNSSIYSAACDVDNWSDIIEIAAGCGYTLGLHSDGTVVALGYNDYGQQEGTYDWKDITVMSK